MELLICNLFNEIGCKHLANWTQSTGTRYVQCHVGDKLYMFSCKLNCFLLSINDDHEFRLASDNIEDILIELRKLKENKDYIIPYNKRATEMNELIRNLNLH